MYSMDIAFCSSRQRCPKAKTCKRAYPPMAGIFSFAGFLKTGSECSYYAPSNHRITKEHIERLRDIATKLWNQKTEVRNSHGRESDEYTNVLWAYAAASARVAFALSTYEEQQVTPPQEDLVSLQWAPITPENAPFPEKE